MTETRVLLDDYSNLQIEYAIFGDLVSICSVKPYGKKQGLTEYNHSYCHFLICEERTKIKQKRLRESFKH